MQWLVSLNYGLDGCLLRWRSGTGLKGGGNSATSKRKKKKQEKQQLATDGFHLLVISGFYHFFQLLCKAKQFLLMRIFEVFKASGNFGLAIEVLLFSGTLGPLILDVVIM